MSNALRCAIYVVCAVLWVSGCAWLLVHFFFPMTTDFGPAPNPWEPVFLRLQPQIEVTGTFKHRKAAGGPYEFCYLNAALGEWFARAALAGDGARREGAECGAKVALRACHAQ